MGDADSSGPALWPLTSLTTCGGILHVSLSTVHFVWGLFVLTVKPTGRYCRWDWWLCFQSTFISFHSVAHPEPSVRLLLALYRQHQRISIGQGEPEFMVLPLAVLRCIDHGALGQQQVHIGACVLRTLIALQKREESVNWRRAGGVAEAVYVSWIHDCMVSSRLLTCSLFSRMTVSCFAHWPKRFLRSRKAQMRQSRAGGMELSSEGHWWVSRTPGLLSSSSSS